MCGICGIVGDHSPENIESMVAAMRHRGPDDAGLFRDDGIALGMTRLAVIDLSPRGRQPMANGDGSVRIVYNGEAYNFREERALLERKGHSFRSASDTEVVLRMYEEYGDDFLRRLRGMFALAIHDRRGGPGKERLLLARDHLGIKPLLYARRGPRFLFASEMKALLASGLVERAVDPDALRVLLTFGAIVQPATAVAGVRMLPPGHRLVLESGRERLERFWRLEEGRRAELRGLPYEELVAAARAALEESVRLQMVGDVPVGAFLSGGVDSALLVALMAKASPGKVRTFSVGFEAEGAHIDETDDAERAAAFLGTDHERVVVRGRDVRDRVERIAAALDQPSVDGVNSYFVSRAASGHVKVAISGTGGDELFAGYPWFIYMEMARLRAEGHPVRAAARKALGGILRLPVFDPLAVGRFAGFVDAAREEFDFFSRYARITRIFGVEGTARILAPDVRRSVRAGREPAYDLAKADALPGAGPVERMSAICLRGYALNQLLRDIDAVSMAHSLEVRVPYLDPVVTDLALSLPSSGKLGDISGLADPLYRPYGETGAKRILIDAGRGLLPAGMERRRKRGFGMPFESWLKGPLRDVLEDTLSADAVRRRGLFDAGAVRGLAGDFLGGRVPWTRPWLLMITELWCREVLSPRRPAGEAPAGAAAPPGGARRTGRGDG